MPVDEIERIRAAYKKRKNEESLYSLFNPGQLLMTQQLERALLRVLADHGVTSLRDKRILEVGCGAGWRLQQFINYGAQPENLSAVDLQENAILAAQAINPKIEYTCGNAENLPFPDQSFHLILQFVVFTSILHQEMKHNVAAEMLRVLQPTGFILWYDYYVSKPTNPDVKGIRRREIRDLFPNCMFEFHRVTLAPPLVRVIAPHSFLLCYLLEKIPWLCMHYLVVIRKKVPLKTDCRLEASV